MYNWLMNLFDIQSMTNINSNVLYCCCALAVVMFTVVAVMLCTMIIKVFWRKK